MPPLTPEVCFSVVCIYITICVAILVHEALERRYAQKDKSTKSKYGYFENIVSTFKISGNRAYCDVYVRANAAAGIGIDKLIIHIGMQTRRGLKWADDVSKIFIFDGYHASAKIICHITEEDKCRMCVIIEACAGNVELEREVRYCYDKK